MERFFEIKDIYYETRGDRPGRVFSRTWIFERAETLDYRVTGPLDTYVKLTREVSNRPNAWWRDRGRKILTGPPKPHRA